MSRGGEIKETKLQFRKMVIFFSLIWVDWAQNICFFWTTFSSNCLIRQIPNQPITWQRFNAFRHVAVLAMLKKKKREKNKASMIWVSAWDQLVKHQRSEVLQIFGVHLKHNTHTTLSRCSDPQNILRKAKGDEAPRTFCTATSRGRRRRLWPKHWSFSPEAHWSATLASSSLPLSHSTQVAPLRRALSAHAQVVQRGDPSIAAANWHWCLSTTAAG